MREDNSKISLDLPIELRDILIKQAKDREMSLSGYIRLIIKKYLSEENKGD